MPRDQLLPLNAWLDPVEDLPRYHRKQVRHLRNNDCVGSVIARRAPQQTNLLPSVKPQRSRELTHFCSWKRTQQVRMSLWSGGLIGR